MAQGVLGAQLFSCRQYTQTMPEIVETQKSDLPEGSGFRIRCQWITAGDVSHWGHLHQRRNRYEADFVVQPIDEAWKITETELVNEQRL